MFLLGVGRGAANFLVLTDPPGGGASRVVTVVSISSGFCVEDDKLLYNLHYVYMHIHVHVRGIFISMLTLNIDSFFFDMAALYEGGGASMPNPNGTGSYFSSSLCGSPSVEK